MKFNERRIYATFDGRSRTPLPALAEALLNRQQRDWPQLAAGYAALDMRRERWLTAGDLSVLLQCNPQRVVSTSANTDPAAIKRRPCFLCLANLPAGQQAILYHRHFFVLCNPFPIVSRHYTIAHREHLPQALHGVIPKLLQLARDFHPDYALLYNGPQSGASAPDHRHFQALPKASIPALNEVGQHITKVCEKNGVALYKQIDGARTAWQVEGENAKDIAVLMRLLLRAMRRLQAPLGDTLQKKVSPLHAEPMLNLFCLYAAGRWRVMIFPRRQHRPSAYYKSGEEQILVSPGAVDMGGVLVLPREVDYNRLDAALLMNIFQEISLGEAIMDEIVAAL
ncbi:MAG: DUF4922 domain-containing protein [Deltaproteobacteria bacterium]|nr:DUF4922 domain-containing protein [Deltaproteobacteria bacterium]